MKRLSVPGPAMLVFMAILGGVAGPAAADHSFIEGPFASGPEVTRVCLECHADAATDIMQTSHWTWRLDQEIAGRRVQRGKFDSINNFCVAIHSNEPRCTSCHIGYGWRDASFDFEDPTLVDCLVCHDTTDSYRKTPTGAGHPAQEVDLLHVAQNVGPTSRQTCGNCHFFGGGGDAVKHGDLDSSMAAPGRELDVHMAVEGNNFSCIECHTATDHHIAGQAMVVSPTAADHIGCTGCHGEEAHAESLLNQHSATVACQTCHIPTFARKVATKVAWDWSTAGQDLAPENDEHGRPVYDKKKGHFRWGKDIVPEYAWYNGNAGVYEVGQTIDPDAVTRLNYPLGERGDPQSRLYPFKIHTGKQIYDRRHQYFLLPQVFGEGGYWQTYDWHLAATNGMKDTGLEFSGEYGFAETVMYWRINHMVVPKEQALDCLDCHGDAGRLDWVRLGYDGDPMRRVAGPDQQGKGRG